MKTNGDWADKNENRHAPTDGAELVSLERATSRRPGWPENDAVWPTGDAEEIEMAEAYSALGKLLDGAVPRADLSRIVRRAGEGRSETGAARRGPAAMLAGRPGAMLAGRPAAMLTRAGGAALAVAASLLLSVVFWRGTDSVETAQLAPAPTEMAQPETAPPVDESEFAWDDALSDEIAWQEEQLSELENSWRQGHDETSSLWTQISRMDQELQADSL